MVLIRNTRLGNFKLGDIVVNNKGNFFTIVKIDVDVKHHWINKQNKLKYDQNTYIYNLKKWTTSSSHAYFFVCVNETKFLRKYKKPLGANVLYGTNN